jgi:aminoglycoside 6'-N-acetyltransferase I
MARASEGRSDDVTISLLTSTDSAVLRAVAALCVVAWGRQPTDVEVNERAAKLRQEILALAPDAKGSFVARTAGAIVGFGQVTRDKDHAQHWWLGGLVVEPRHRRRGIGRALAAARIAYARARGATTILSETHLDNPTSIRYHEGIGFTNNGVFTAADGDRKVAFRLDLA